MTKDASTIVVAVDGVDSLSGAMYLFQMTNSMTTTKWTQMGKFVAADRDIDDSLGSSIAIKNNIVVVGAWGDDFYKGSVYIHDTGFSSSSTTAPIPVATPEPTRSPTPNPTNPLSDNDSSTPTILPMTIPPTLKISVPPMHQVPIHQSIINQQYHITNRTTHF
jgi:hypothetical protein